MNPPVVASYKTPYLLTNGSVRPLIDGWLTYMTRSGPISRKRSPREHFRPGLNCSSVLDEATPDAFRPHVGSTFTVEVAGGDPLELVLEEVELRGAGHAGREQPFALLFSGPTDRMAPQATLILGHPALGELALFVVPVGPGRYEAVFN